jgi:hypothetical protein
MRWQAEVRRLAHRSVQHNQPVRQAGRVDMQGALNGRAYGVRACGVKDAAPGIFLRRWLR